MLRQLHNKLTNNLKDKLATKYIIKTIHKGSDEDIKAWLTNLHRVNGKVTKYDFAIRKAIIKEARARGII